MTAIQKRLMTDSAWLRSIECDAVRGLREHTASDFGSQAIRDALRSAAARRAERRADARVRGDTVAAIMESHSSDAECFRGAA